MKEVFITEETISRYESYLRENEKAKSTIGKYVQAVRAFGCYLRQAPVTKGGPAGVPGDAAGKGTGWDGQHEDFGAELLPGFCGLA